MGDVTTQPGPVVADTLDDLLAGAERREPFSPDDRRSGARFERVWIDGAPHIVKYLHADDDFMMRAHGDPGSRSLAAYRAGLFDVAPDVIDHAVVAAAPGTGRDGLGCALLMRDVSPWLVAIGDTPLRPDEHGSFLDHLAALSAATWGFTDDVGLMPYERRWSAFDHSVIEAERAGGWKERVPQIAEEGWARFAERAPHDVATGVDALLRDATALTTALRTTPSCLLHGDWKASNLGTAPDGRTVLIDWVYVGEGPACHDLAWYVSINRQMLPVTKEEACEQFRRALESHGVATDAWWSRQLSLCLLGATVELGWEKALGDDDELGWWCDCAREGLRLL